jgi:hypothetical protein
MNSSSKEMSKPSKVGNKSRKSREKDSRLMSQPRNKPSSSFAAIESSTIRSSITPSPTQLNEINKNSLRSVKFAVLNARQQVTSAPVLKEALGQIYKQTEQLSSLVAVAMVLEQELPSIKLVKQIGQLPKFKTSDGKAAHATLILDLHEIYDNAKSAIALRSKPTRLAGWDSIEKAFSALKGLMSTVDALASQELLHINQPNKNLKFVKVPPQEFDRKFMRGRDVKLPPKGFEVCPFCDHSYSDSAPCNVSNLLTNKTAWNEYATKQQHLSDYKAKKRPDKLVDENGKEIKNVSPPFQFKELLHCHCHQQKSSIQNSDVNSTCPVFCVDQDTQAQYPVGGCPFCKCNCSATYYLEDVPNIKASVIVHKEEPATAKKDGQQFALDWLQNVNGAGNLAMASATAALPESVIKMPSKSTQDYLADIYSVAKGSQMVRSLPSIEASEWMNTNIVDNALYDPKRPSMIRDALSGTIIDLRTSSVHTTTASRTRANNNNLGMTTNEILAIAPVPPLQGNIQQSPDSSIEIISPSKCNSAFTKPVPDSVWNCESDHGNIEKIKRMRKRAHKKMNSLKRASQMTVEEKEDRKAAKIVDLHYAKILGEGNCKDEIEKIANSLSDDDYPFDSQQYNDCMMNLHGYPSDEE